MPCLICFENGQMLECTSAWIGDKEAFSHYQQYYLGAATELSKKGNKNAEIVVRQ
jgi:hypothetical protein